MHAYILGVPDSYRGRDLEADLTRYQIRYSVVDAPDGSLWSDEQLERVYSRRAARIVAHRQLSRGEVACVIGHQLMMRAFVAEGSTWALFLEDDARIVQDLEPLVEGLAGLPAAPIVVQLDMRVPPDNPPREAVSHEEGHIVRRHRAAYGTCGYLMNRRAALVALAAYHHRRVDSAADWPFCWAARVQFWVPDAEFVTHPVETQRSLIEEHRLRELQRARERSSVVRWSSAALRLTGLWAAWGRVNNVPFVPLYRRDLGEVLLRLSRVPGTSEDRAPTPSEPPTHGYRP